MSLLRSLSPACSSSSLLFFKALAIASVPRSCPHASRLLSTSISHPQSSKRDLYTAPSYRPYSLPDSIPPPPRSAGIADTSIAGLPTLEVNDTRRPQVPHQDTQVAEGEATISLPESEAQKSISVDQGQHQTPQAQEASSPPPSDITVNSEEDTKKAPQRKGKLKARKAAISISPPALSHLQELLSQPSPKMIRVGVKNRGCSGLAYHLEYVDKPGTFDEVVEQDGVKVLVDSKALFSIIGSEMDWQEDKLSTRFVFKNPNVKEQCGCGESFMV